MDRSRRLTRRTPHTSAGGPLRVLFVIGRLEPGGSEGQLTNLVLRAHPQRIEATVATLYPTRSRQHLDRLAQLGVAVHPLSGEGGRMRGFAAVTARLPRLVRTLRPDVVYAWLEEAASVAVPVARALRIPVVVSRRNVCGSSFERHAPVRIAIRRIEAAATLVTANSVPVRHEAIRRGVAADRVRVVLNGHDELAPLDAPAAPPVRLGYLAHLRAEKGHLRLLDALDRLPPGLQWHADLAGEGALEARLQAEIARRGLGDRVSLVGVVDSRSFWASHHVAVLLSDYEGSSNTLIEAAMAGRALLATNVAGNPDVVAPGGGLLVPLDDGEATAAALARLVADAELRAKLGAQAHRQAIERFSMERFVDGHVAVLEAAAGRKDDTVPDHMQTPAPPDSFTTEVATGERFEFGENWSAFLKVLDEDRIEEAQSSLREMLGRDLAGLTFLDVGSGSGLFSLAAVRLGAKRVHSFDFDPSSVACTRELRRRYAPKDVDWVVEQGSALDPAYLGSLGRFDVVYSWGVLHHTGDMWKALGNTVDAVGDGGRLFISIYNDQGPRSRLWRVVKRLYNALPAALRLPFTLLVMLPREVLSALKATVLGRPQDYVRGWTNYKRSRGMSRWHDLVDWVGGYPFEVARPEEIFDFVRVRGFTLERLTTCGGGLGCNQYVFVRSTAP